MDEDLKRAIEDLHVVISVRFHAGDKTHKSVVYANLRCSAASSHGGCDVKLVGPIRMSTRFPTLRDCLRELGRLIQQDQSSTLDREARGPCDDQPHRKRCDVSAEEFERRSALVQDEKFLYARASWLSVMSGLGINPANREITSSSGRLSTKTFFFSIFFQFFLAAFSQKT
jgi:hypothetical protein